jgi:hypothetical protein
LHSQVDRMLMMSRHGRPLSLCDGESITLGARLQGRPHRVRVSFRRRVDASISVNRNRSGTTPTA